ncbi:sulfotransferase family protein [Alkalisalibacterium limincola]|nr:sulfotransferase [Alkalisalibacterium limincola]
MTSSSNLPPPISWHAHPDPQLEALLARADPASLRQALDNPGVRADSFARLRVVDALYRCDPGDEQLEWRWLQEMLLSNRPAAAWPVVQRWPQAPGTGFERLFLAAQVAQIAAPRGEAARRYQTLLQAFPDRVDAWQKALEFDPGLPVDQSGMERLDAWTSGPDAYACEKAAFARSSLLRTAAPSESFALAMKAQALKQARIGRWNLDALVGQLAGDRAAVPVPVSGSASPGVRPVFIVGLPRSGTTLLSAMLAAHPRVSTAGEQGLVAALAMGPARSQVLSGAAHGGLYQDWYLAAVGDLTDGADVVVDKMPLNAEHVGIILAAFPDALVVHIERDLPDVAASIHLHDFDFGCGFSMSAGDIGAYAGVISRHLSHWRERAPGRVLEVAYEALTQDAPKALSPVLERLGLAWDARMADFWKRPQSVATFSEAQVRRPLNRDAVGAWRRYLPAAEGFMRELEAQHRFRRDATG